MNRVRKLLKKIKASPLKAGELREVVYKTYKNLSLEK